LNSLAGELVGGAVVAYGTYRLIDARFHLRQERDQRAKISRGILRAIENELRRNIDAAQRLLKHLPERGLPYFGFETSGGALLSEVPALSTLNPATVQALLETYAQIRAADEQHQLLFDLTYGATGAISTLMAGSATTDAARDRIREIAARRDELRERLLERVRRLEPQLRDALASVEGDLGSADLRPAAESARPRSA
jgi:hypothetical protein